MSAFSNYRHPNSNRSNTSNDDTSNDLKSTIRESRWIQPEQWDSTEFQEKFDKVKIRIFSTSYKKTNKFFLRVRLTSLKFMVCFNN